MITPSEFLEVHRLKKQCLLSKEDAKQALQEMDAWVEDTLRCVADRHDSRSGRFLFKRLQHALRIDKERREELISAQIEASLLDSSDEQTLACTPIVPAPLLVDPEVDLWNEIDVLKQKSRLSQIAAEAALLDLRAWIAQTNTCLSARKDAHDGHFLFYQACNALIEDKECRDALFFMTLGQPSAADSSQFNDSIIILDDDTPANSPYDPSNDTIILDDTQEFGQLEGAPIAEPVDDCETDDEEFRNYYLLNDSDML